MDKEILVRIIRDATYPDLSRHSPAGTMKWNNITFTEDPIAECDYLIVINSTTQSIYVKTLKGGKWLFTQESPVPDYVWQKKLFPFFDRVYSFWEDSAGPQYREQTCLPWHIDRTYDELIVLRHEDLKPKRDQVSWVTSNNAHKPGQKVRLEFLRHIQDSEFPLGLYGRGFNPIDDKFDGIAPYKYSIAMENYACEHYWTEKISDCFLSWTMPIYFGCTNILDYFPKESMIIIDPKKPDEAMRIIESAIKNNLWEKSLSAIKEARELMLNKYNFFPAMAHRVEEHFNALPTNTRAPRQWSFLPVNTPNDTFSISDKLKIHFRHLNAVIKNIL